MATKISFGLSQKEIKNAIKELKSYQESLSDKCEEFCRRLMVIGQTTAEAHVADSPLGKYITVSTDISKNQTGCSAILFATGEIKTNQWETLDGVQTANVSTLMMIEFGAGSHYNSQENPFAKDLGMGVGTFPNATHSFDNGGWYYKDLNDVWHHSYGVKATMPMYHASEDMLLQIEGIAKEVFHS